MKSVRTFAVLGALVAAGLFLNSYVPQKASHKYLAPRGMFVSFGKIAHAQEFPTYGNYGYCYDYNGYGYDCDSGYGYCYDYNGYGYECDGGYGYCYDYNGYGYECGYGNN